MIRNERDKIFKHLKFNFSIPPEDEVQKIQFVHLWFVIDSYTYFEIVSHELKRELI